MSVITPDNNDVFKSARIVFAKARWFLSSYGDVNLIDEGEFPTYVNEILRLLGIAVYKEMDAVVKIKNYKGKLPCDFAQLYAAYKCTPYVMSNSAVNHPQGQPISVYNDVTWELLEASAGCDIQTLQVTANDPKIIEHISVRQYVREERQELNFKDPILLRLSPNMRRDLCGDDCTNTFSTSPFEIAISSNQILTNFKNDAVYMKYYGFPKDEDGIPMIMDEERLEKCIEWYIIYQELLRWWMNKSVSDIDSRLQYAEQQYNDWYETRRSYQKTPAFSQMVNNIRRNRAVNKIAIFTK